VLKIQASIEAVFDWPNINGLGRANEQKRLQTGYISKNTNEVYQI
jgi:hypothetical protein